MLQEERLFERLETAIRILDTISDKLHQQLQLLEDSSPGSCDAQIQRTQDLIRKVDDFHTLYLHTTQYLRSLPFVPFHDELRFRSLRPNIDQLREYSQHIHTLTCEMHDSFPVFFTPVFFADMHDLLDQDEIVLLLLELPKAVLEIYELCAKVSMTFQQMLDYSLDTDLEFNIFHAQNYQYKKKSIPRSKQTLNIPDITRKLEHWMKLAPPPLQCANIAAEIDEVQFRCAAPMILRPGKFFAAKIMMFREDDTARADQEAGLMGGKMRVSSSDVIEAEKGQEFTLRLQSPDLPELDEVKTIRWNGKYAARDFQILLPSDYDREQLRLLGRVYSDMTPMTDISLILEVSNPVPQEVVCEKVRLRTAFVSYASKDRAEVVKRIQGMEAAHMDVFIDVDGLRRGEEYEPRLYQEIRDRDLFYLFWSRNAAASEWVMKELSYALAHKPMTQIEPIPLETPEVCPPPDSLKHRHFRDWTLNYTT